MRDCVAVGVVGFLLVLSPAANADPNKCPQATAHYAAALAEASDALTDYTHCIDTSRGHDGCAQEFLRLQLAQDDFAAGVSAFQNDCP